MEQEYFVYAIVNGFSYIVCHNGKGGYEVLHKPPDHLVARFTYNDAKKTAENSSKGKIEFKYKPIPQ